MTFVSDLAIRVADVSKVYEINPPSRRHGSLVEAISYAVRRPISANQQKEKYWALKRIDLEVNRGDVVGLIGRNGAGKSTLLKILSRITRPSSGRIELYGRTGALLEVGTGFHPELTGRENIFLNGAILGMTRAEILREFDSIVDFSGVEQFLETPVKRYSSGMYVRLAFAVAAHLRSEILIVDEVLAVGDSEFQKKCLGKMQNITKDGRTVLFVSHNLTVVSNLCTKGILLDRGSVKHIGTAADCVEHYADLLQEKPDEPENFQGTGIRSIQVIIEGRTGGPASLFDETVSPNVVFDCVFPKSSSLNLGFTIVRNGTVPVLSASAADLGIKLEEGAYRISVPLPVDRLPSGDYYLEAKLWEPGVTYSSFDQTAAFTVVNGSSNRTGQLPRGACLLEKKWMITPL